jgi:hypothetical protein
MAYKGMMSSAVVLCAYNELCALSHIHLEVTNDIGLHGVDNCDLKFVEVDSEEVMPRFAGYASRASLCRVSFSAILYIDIASYVETNVKRMMMVIYEMIDRLSNDMSPLYQDVGATKFWPRLVSLEGRHGELCGLLYSLLVLVGLIAHVSKPPIKLKWKHSLLSPTPRPLCNTNTVTHQRTYQPKSITSVEIFNL